jgi:ABC-2 type transport system ATP-binding protein
VIEVVHLTKSYGPHVAVDDLNFSVKKGEILGFLGPNGAGKSTTMKIITGFMPATQGQVRVAGFDVFDEPLEVKRNIGYLPENPPIYHEMIVKDYLVYAAKLRDVPRDKITNSVNSAMERTGLTHVSGRLIGNLSKGYKQRVGIAQTLVHNPLVLVLDEPTVGLDPVQILEIRSLIKSLSGDHTVILSTHILPEVTATCERIVVINKGKIVAEDSIQSLTRGGQYALIVKNPLNEGINALREITGVESVTTLSDRIVVKIKDPTVELRDVIVQVATQKGMGVLEFTSDKMSLEEVFVNLVRHGQN